MLPVTNLFSLFSKVFVNATDNRAISCVFVDILCVTFGSHITSQWLPDLYRFFVPHLLVKNTFVIKPSCAKLILFFVGQRLSHSSRLLVLSTSFKNPNPRNFLSRSWLPPTMQISDSSQHNTKKSFRIWRYIWYWMELSNLQSSSNSPTKQRITFDESQSTWGDRNRSEGLAGRFYFFENEIGASHRMVCQLFHFR